MQYVEFNGHRSLRNEIFCEVPGGSILGHPFFFQRTHVRVFGCKAGSGYIVFSKNAVKA